MRPGSAANKCAEGHARSAQGKPPTKPDPARRPVLMRFRSGRRNLRRRECSNAPRMFAQKRAERPARAQGSEPTPKIRRAGAPQNFGRGAGATCVIRRSRASVPLEPGVRPAQDGKHFSGRFSAPPARLCGKRPLPERRRRKAPTKDRPPDCVPLRELPCGTSLQ